MRLIYISDLRHFLPAPCYEHVPDQTLEYAYGVFRGMLSGKPGNASLSMHESRDADQLISTLSGTDHTDHCTYSTNLISIEEDKIISMFLCSTHCS
jgi:hypothetical protein